MAEYSIGVDLGGTNLRAGCDQPQTAKSSNKISGHTELSEGRDAVIADMVESILTLKQAAGRRLRSRASASAFPASS